MNTTEAMSGGGYEALLEEPMLQAGSLRATLTAIGFCGLLGGLLPFLFQPAPLPRFSAVSTVRVLSADDASVDSAIAGLKSRQNLDNLIHALDLTHDEGFATRDPGVVQVIYDIVTGGGRTVAEAEAQVRDRLGQAIAVHYDHAARLLRISVTTGNSAKAGKIADMVGEGFADALAIGSVSVDPAVEGLRQALERSQAALSGFLAQTDEKRVAELRQYRADRQALATQISQADTDLAQLGRKASLAASMTIDDVFAKPLPDSLEFTGLEYQRQRHVEAKLALDQLSANLGPRHPRLLAAQAALDEVRKDLQLAIRQLSSSLQRDQAEAARQLADLKARRDRMSSDKATTDAADRLAALEAAVDEAHENYLQGQQNGAVAVAKPPASMVRLGSPAVTRRIDTGASIPWAWCAAGAGLGMAAATAVAIVRRRRNLELDVPELDVAEPEAGQTADDFGWMQEIDLLAGSQPAAGEPLHLDDLKAVAAAMVEADVSSVPRPPLPLVAANDRSLVDQINDVLMASRRPVAEIEIPPLVAAVLAGGAGPVDVRRPAAVRPSDHVLQGDEQPEVLALRREMAEIREKLRSYSDLRQAARG